MMRFFLEGLMVWEMSENFFKHTGTLGTRKVLILYPTTKQMHPSIDKNL